MSLTGLLLLWELVELQHCYPNDSCRINGCHDSQIRNHKDLYMYDVRN